MEIYFILLGWSFITGFIFYGINSFSINNKKLKIIYCCINYIPLAVVLGFRDRTVGTDTNMYHSMFVNIAKYDFEWSYLDGQLLEIGYRLINKLISFFVADDNIAIMLIAFITIGGFAVFFYKNSCNIWLTTFLFVGFGYYIETYNTMRQVLACMIICNAVFLFLKEKKYIKWIISILIAATIHFPSIIFLGFTKVLPLNKKKLIIYILPLILIYFFIDNFGEYFILLNDTGKYGGYFSSENNVLSINDILKIMLFLGTICWGYYKRNLFNEKEKKILAICGIFLIYASGCILMKSKIEIFYRFVQYFSIYFCVLCPFVLKKSGGVRYIFFIGILICIPFVLSIILSNNPDFKYSTFF